MEGEDYWNNSENKAFSFDEDDRVYSNKTLFTDVRSSTINKSISSLQSILHSPTERKLFVDDNTSELSYDFPTSDIPLHLIIPDDDLNKGNKSQCMVK